MQTQETAEDVLQIARAGWERYAEPLLREVMQHLLKPRNQWPPEELIDRGLSTLTNAAIVDRRVQDLPPAARKLLAVMGIARLSRWRVGQLIAVLATLGHAEGLTPILDLLKAGLAQPIFTHEGDAPVAEFEQWIGLGAIDKAEIFVHPAVTARASEVDLELPTLPTRRIDSKARPISDGLEWLLRTAAVWARVAGDPLRLTQHGLLFKRDLQKFQTDDLLASPFAEQLITLPDVGLLSLEFAQSARIVSNRDGELRHESAPAIWNGKLAAALLSLSRGLLTIRNWDPLTGHLSSDETCVFPSVILPIFVLLRSLPENDWVQAAPLADYVYSRHPAWSSLLKKKADQSHLWVEKTLLGIGYPLRLIEAVQEPGGWWFRLGDIGRSLLAGQAAREPDHEFNQTLIVQPNGEMVVFRQGLSPELIGKLTRFADWRTFGSACTMEVTATSVYRGLETGMTQADMQRLLEQHGTRAVPATVLDSLQRWSSKRERITVWASATLLEFSSSEDLDSAFSRGLVSVRVTDRIGIAIDGEELDYKHFRLVGNRDYESRPQKCLSFDGDGVSFSVDTAQSDLVLEAELGQIAIPSPTSPGGPRRFHMTPDSLRLGQARGFNISELEQWAVDRSGEPLSAAARLIATGSNTPALYARKLVIRFASEAIADGAMQYPPLSGLIEERIGPESVIVSEENLPILIEELKSVGVSTAQEEQTG